jgi:hypothetical protein
MTYQELPYSLVSGDWMNVIWLISEPLQLREKVGFTG